MTGTDFPESVKLEARKRAAFKCCFCRDRMGDEVHHLISKEEGGQGVFDNAILLCVQCHTDYGNNPLKRKQLRQARDDWYEIVEKRDSKTVIDQVEQLATKDDVEQLTNELKRLSEIVITGLMNGTTSKSEGANVASSMVSSISPSLSVNVEAFRRFRRSDQS